MTCRNALGFFSVLSSKCFSIKPVQTLARHSAVLSNDDKFSQTICIKRTLGLGPTSKDFDESSTGSIPGPITKLHASELVRHLNDTERRLLYRAIEEYQSNKVKEEFEDMLAGQRWRSKLGRPSKIPTLGDVDPTGTYCPMPEDWLKKKYAATVPKPTKRELLHLAVVNSIPFIGFGFLDNFIMLIAGDSIESGMSAYITLSTMAAAALGNTFSDIIGIGSSYYVERAAAMLGAKPPPLSPTQLEMPSTRRFANMGRVIGITIGCFLGMIPLLFRDDSDKKHEANSGKKEGANSAKEEEKFEQKVETSNESATS